nr:fatty acid desaturase family protein [uncultured Rhodoferax sp.]
MRSYQIKIDSEELSLEQKIREDLTAVREALALSSIKKKEIFSTIPLRTGLHVVFDCGWIAASLMMTLTIGWLAVPVAMLIIGNRQRAIGNILHDFGHRNVSRNPFVNDFLAKFLVAPLVFADFENYRKTHLLHHMHLGDSMRDPDYLHGSSWKQTFLLNLTSAGMWSQTILGDFATPIVAGKKIYIGIWWSVLLGVIAGFASLWTASIFFGLWMSARATTFFAITLFREMCDHFGREPGGIFLFTRDITSRGLLRHLIHPRNNGYHLTHHLLPTVPYHHLPNAHKALSETNVFQQKACTCSSYFFGPHSVIRLQLT